MGDRKSYKIKLQIWPSNEERRKPLSNPIDYLLKKIGN
jgi:hypothetical protein